MVLIFRLLDRVCPHLSFSGLFLLNPTIVLLNDYRFVAAGGFPAIAPCIRTTFSEAD